MWKTTVAFCVIVLADSAMAQTVPSEVVEFCQQNVEANDLPECLGEGSVGFLLLERAATDGYFGSEAARVVEICQAQNDTFASSWTCVAEAADNALETARLIGRAAIADECVRALADGDTVQRLEDEQRDLRSLYRPNTRYYGGTMYFPFRGCPQIEPSEGQAGIAPEAPAFDTTECEAIGALDEFLAGRTAEELSAIIPVLELLPEDERLPALSQFGLDEPVLNVIIARMERSSGDALGMSMLGLGLLERNHADLVLEVFEMGQTDTPLVDQFAAGFLSMLTEAAIEGYESVCDR